MTKFYFMQTASPSSLIETIITLIFIYYILKFLARLFLPLLAKKVVEKAIEQFQKQQYNYSETNQNQNIKKSKSYKPHETKKVGDYVDFEEIE